MSEPTMRERIARAICRKELSGALSGVDLDYRVDIEWPGYAWHADAVLAEMETPTEAMLNAGGQNNCTGDYKDPGAAWSAMIAEARKA